MTPLNIVVGITGGIAAYKAVGVIRGLVLAGHNVHVVATEAALRFIGRPTLEAMSRNIVHSDLYEGVAQVRHVALGQAADVIVVAPATAHTIAKLAAGLADDLLGTTILASLAPLVIAPAMHSEMWHNPATASNIALLEARGVHLVGPVSGQLTGTDSGIGRMADADEIIAATLAAVAVQDFHGTRMLVTAGGTREPLDPVRFIGNRSSGMQGVAIAVAARDRGASVTLIAAHLDVPVPPGIDVIEVGTALELEAAVITASPFNDVIIMAAAVADYRPADVQSAKIKKSDHQGTLTLSLVQNPDILARISHSRTEGQVIVGFAAETEADDAALLFLARAKLERKGCDYLVVNRVGWTTGFSTVDNAVMMLDRGGDIVMETAGSKVSVAGRILDLLA